MRKLLLTLTLLFSVLSFSQITTTSVSDKKVIIDDKPYDSLSNFLKRNCSKYVNQELYLLPQSISLRKFGYKNFILDYNKSIFDEKNIYKYSKDSYSSKYEELSGKYFTVLEVINHPKQNDKLYEDKYFLKLKEKEKGTILYYEYDSKYEHSFPFLVVGYFLKSKKVYIGKEVVVRGKNWVDSSPMFDISTGNPVSFDVGGIWKCVDISVEERFYKLSMILENDKSERIAFSLNSYDNINYRNFYLFDNEDVRKYILKFGKDDWETILNGKVKVGFTEEMVLLSWGKPKDINRSSYSDQWVYSEQYLYFYNGKLKSFN